MSTLEDKLALALLGTICAVAGGISIGEAVAGAAPGSTATLAAIGVLLLIFATLLFGVIAARSSCWRERHAGGV